MSSYILIFISIFFFISCSGKKLPNDFFNPPSPYGEHSKESVDYLLELGFCSELLICNNPIIRKWNSPIRIQLHGNYTKQEDNELNKIISELSELTGLNIKKVTNNPNINIYFVNQHEFKTYIPQYDESNIQNGVFILFSDNNNNNERATICIQTDLHAFTRLHLLREELTQSLGLMQDSYKYTDSIFQQDPQFKPIQYSQLDTQVIKLLYNKKIKTGMTKQEVIKLLTPPTQIANTNH